MTIETKLNFYPVAVSGEEQQKKNADGSYTKTGCFQVTVLALDNDLKKNSNGLYVSGGKQSNIALQFYLKKEFIDKFKFLTPVTCIADLTPTSYDFFIKIKAVEVDGKIIKVEDAE